MIFSISQFIWNIINLKICWVLRLNDVLSCTLLDIKNKILTLPYQGYPLFSYMFIKCLCDLCLITLISRHLHPFNLRNRGPTIFHLFFTDFIFLFAHAQLPIPMIVGSWKKSSWVMRLCASSGQQVSLYKSKILCSPKGPSTQEEKKYKLCYKACPTS